MTKPKKRTTTTSLNQYHLHQQQLHQQQQQLHQQQQQLFQQQLFHAAGQQHQNDNNLEQQQQQQQHQLNRHNVNMHAHTHGHVHPQSAGTTTTATKTTHRNNIAASLSRSINAMKLVKDSQLKSMAMRYDKLSSITDKIDMSIPVWETIVEAKQSTIDSFINSTTATLIQSTRAGNDSLLTLQQAAQQQQQTTHGEVQQLSKAYKSRGNDLFQKKQYLDALLLYTEALRLYNTESTKDQQVLSSIYSNRCLCLVHLEKFEEGAIEATRGLECRNSDYLVHKLLYRRGICYFSMKRHHKARADFQEAHKLVSKMSDPSDIQSIENYLEKINKMNLGDLIDKEMPTEPRHASIVDQRIAFKYGSDSVGRLGETTDLIASNTILFQEKAYVFCLDRYSHSSYCHNCLKEILAPIYCKKCNLAQYCGDECLKEDYNNFHEKECGKGFLLLCSTESLMVIRILAKKSKERASSKSKESNVTVVENNIDTQYIPQPTGVFDPPEPEVMFSNSSNNNSSNSNIDSSQLHSPSKSTRIISNDASDLLDNIQDDTDEMNGEPLQAKSNIYSPNYDLIYSFDPHYNEHPNSKLASIIFEACILERFLNIHHKSLGIMILGQDEFCQHGIQRYVTVKVAYVIFPTASLLNHSCDNNTLVQYKGNSILIKSLKDIEKNEEVSISYGPHIYHLDLRERLKALKSEYFFICRCKSCNEKAGPNPLRCPTTNGKSYFCAGTLLETVNVAKLTSEIEAEEDDDEDDEGLTFDNYNNRVFECSKCNAQLTPTETGLLTSNAILTNIMLSTALQQMTTGDTKETEGLLAKCLEMRSTIFHENSKKIGEVYDSFARLYIQEDNYKDAVKYAEKAVHNMFVRLGHSHSTELARECAKLANIYINGGEPFKAIKAINTAEALLVKWKTESGDDEILAQLRNHKKVLEASKVIPGTNKVEINLTQLWSQPDFDSDTFLHRMILYHNKG
ncbi:SET domain-containing protein [Heterostelium album PN500]|uniref:Protein-lysine N-methyltransferase SMYD4 n=1 Tax=Heterostelium pallidum (strain ATCC 26659 / Pp 5 / PN500) TaxID=670386 RepID=D3BRL8_HETP5|nr:SET domain-containing protein [Heterostelium album PN500]EFA76050.1 SET domain-containing protein [Heterostelium album PN500]|eukprot:XP_020428184.1 SET domain-containing protein [Heterostelium album PN500]